jgi:hypothetical protein
LCKINSADLEISETKGFLKKTCCSDGLFFLELYLWKEEKVDRRWSRYQEKGDEFDARFVSARSKQRDFLNTSFCVSQEIRWNREREKLFLLSMILGWCWVSGHKRRTDSRNRSRR